MIRVDQLKEANESALKDIIRLLTQLRHDPAEHVGSISDLQKIIRDPNIITMVVKDNDRVVGMAALYLISKVGRIEGHIDEVVVDSEYRGQGLGEKLVQALIDAARSTEVSELSLTSRPARVPANNLYQKLGFKQAETNVYRLKL